MKAACPKCGVIIKPFSVRPHFVCQFCSAPLKGRIFGPLIWSIAIWQFTDIFFFPLFQQLAGDTWLAFIFRTLVCTWIGICLYRVLINECDTVAIDDEMAYPLHSHPIEKDAHASHQRKTA
jgi:hypothetical protein